MFHDGNHPQCLILGALLNDAPEDFVNTDCRNHKVGDILNSLGKEGRVGAGSQILQPSTLLVAEIVKPLYGVALYMPAAR